MRLLFFSIVLCGLSISYVIVTSAWWFEKFPDYIFLHFDRKKVKQQTVSMQFRWTTLTCYGCHKSPLCISLSNYFLVAAYNVKIGLEYFCLDWQVEMLHRIVTNKDCYLLMHTEVLEIRQLIRSFLSSGGSVIRSISRKPITEVHKWFRKYWTALYTPFVICLGDTLVVLIHMYLFSLGCLLFGRRLFYLSSHTFCPILSHVAKNTYISTCLNISWKALDKHWWQNPELSCVMNQDKGQSRTSSWLSPDISPHLVLTSPPFSSLTYSASLPVANFEPCQLCIVL